MGLSKSEKFTKEQNMLAEFAKAFGHPARIAIIQHLLKVNACVCGDLVEELPLSQSTVSQHLKELKKAGIIKGEVEGTRVCYCMNEKVWNEGLGMLNGFFRKIKTCC
jgi:ArsR family transcriptional regulator